MVWAIQAGRNTEAEKPKDDAKVRAVREGDALAENDEDIVITIKIPKPEALIFSKRMDTKYKSIPTRESFLPAILDSAKLLPSNGK